MELSIGIESVAAFVALGVLTGIASGFFGIGGGMIIVPSLLLMGASMPFAVGISIMQMVFSSVFGSILNIRAKKLDLKNGLWMGAGGLIGAAFSGLVLSSIPELYLMGIFALLNTYSLYKFAFKIKYNPNATPPADTAFKRISVLVLAGAFVGVFAISLGIGGGLLLAPILAHYLGFDSKKIVPMALFFIIFASISGVSSMLANGVLDTQLGVVLGAILGASAMLGVWLGGKIMDATSASKHRAALIFMYLFSILATLYKMFSLL